MFNNIFIATTIITLGYRILGFLREILIASKFGAGTITDSFFISQTITTLILEILALGGISSIIISNFDFDNRKALNEKAKIITGNILIISLMIFFILYFFSNILIQVLVPGFEKEKIEITVELTKLSLLTFPLLVVNMIISSFLIGINKGYLISLSNFLYNSIVLLIGWLLSIRFNIKAFVIGINLATIIRSIFIYCYYSKNIGKLELKINFRDENFLKIIKLLIPIIISTLGIQLNFIVDKMVASTLDNGTISCLTYANKLIQLPLGILLGSAILSSYPILVKKIKSNDFNEYLSNKIEIIIIVMGGIVVYILLFSDLIVSILFNKAVYTSDLLTTSQILRYLSFLLITTSIITLFEKVFHSINETKVPARITVYSTILNIILSIILGKKYRVIGIVMATIIGNIFNLLLLVRNIKYRLKFKISRIQLLKLSIFHIIVYLIIYFLMKKQVYIMLKSFYLIKLVILFIGLLLLLSIYYVGLKLLNIDILEKIKR